MLFMGKVFLALVLGIIFLFIKFNLLSALFFEKKPFIRILQNHDISVAMKEMRKKFE